MIGSTDMGGIAARVFISHSSKDEREAGCACEFLEQQGIPCWIAPRDVPAGESFAGAILKALAAAPAVVLIMSRAANASEHVGNEIALAFQNRSLIVPVRLEEVEPERDLVYFLARVNWIHAPPGMGPLQLRSILEILRERERSPLWRPMEAEALRKLEDSARQDDANAQFQLAGYYAGPNGPAHDAAQAVRWLRKAAALGHAESAYQLALAYCKGDGVLRSEPNFLQWVRRAAEFGHASAQIAWGLALLQGRAGGVSPAQAASWLELAARQGRTEADYHLGVLYSGAAGLPRDDFRALAAFRRAAEARHADAQYRLAWMLAQGRGTAKNIAEAKEWAHKSAGQGHTMAAELLREILRSA